MAVVFCLLFCAGVWGGIQNSVGITTKIYGGKKKTVRPIQSQNEIATFLLREPKGAQGSLRELKLKNAPLSECEGSKEVYVAARVE